uniref:Uncharacterized protein n=1 Tax=viral metagenome TaxID=1070528 RepID=A0A6C0H8N5_9ZZZZ
MINNYSIQFIIHDNLILFMKINEVNKVPIYKINELNKIIKVFDK